MQAARDEGAAGGWVRKDEVEVVGAAAEVRVAVPHAGHEDGDADLWGMGVFGGDIGLGADEGDFAVFEDGGGVFEGLAAAGDEEVGADAGDVLFLRYLGVVICVL